MKISKKKKLKEAAKSSLFHEVLENDQLLTQRITIFCTTEPPPSILTV